MKYITRVIIVIIIIKRTFRCIIIVIIIIKRTFRCIIIVIIIIKRTFRCIIIVIIIIKRTFRCIIIVIIIIKRTFLSKYAKLQVANSFGAVVVKIKDEKHLGLILDTNRSFEKHLNESKRESVKISFKIPSHLSQFTKPWCSPISTTGDITCQIPPHHNQPPLGVFPKFSNENCRENPISSSSCYYWYLERLKSIKLFFYAFLSRDDDNPRRVN